MPASSALAPEVVIQAVERAWETFLKRDRRPASPHPTHVYAGAWRPCERRMVLEATAPHMQPAFDTMTLARFRRGNDRERDILSDLARMGRDAEPAFEVVGQQAHFGLVDRKGRSVIRGKVDAFLTMGRAYEYPIEVKAWSPMVVDRIETFEDLFANPWTRSGGYQLLAYLFGHALPLGFMVLDRSGLPKLIPVVLEEHLGKMEEFLGKAERVVDHCEAGTLPAYLEGDPAECQRCGFYGTTCQPPLSAKNTTVVTDPEVELQLTRWHALKDAGREWASLDEKLKKQFRGTEQALAGCFAITGKWGRQTRVELPDDVKKQYTVTDPKGRFTLTIEKVVEPIAAPASTSFTETLERVLAARTPNPQPPSQEPAA